MYAIEEVKTTALSKKLGGPPVFHDGTLKKIMLESNWLVLTIEILSDHNPRLRKNTLVSLKLNNVYAFNLAVSRIKDGNITIHDLEIKREDSGLHLKLETLEGDLSFVRFESIELYEKE